MLSSVIIFEEQAEVYAPLGCLQISSVTVSCQRSLCRAYRNASSRLLLQHLSYGNSSWHVDAAFQQTLWSVAPISSGSEAAQGKRFTLIKRFVLDTELMHIFGIVIMS